MCIIAIKHKGADFPTEQQVNNCLSNNPDGAAIAWNENGKVKVFKSMRKDEFLKKYKSLVNRLSKDRTAMIIHARIATHGSVGIKNCHCWEGCGFAFAHNGILSIHNRDGMTDSETFFRDIFQPIYRHGGWSEATRAIKAVIGTSKFAFLDKEGRVWSFGDYGKDKETGCFFSNQSYSYESRPFRWSGSYGSYGGSFGGHKAAAAAVPAVSQSEYQKSWERYLEDWEK